MDAFRDVAPRTMQPTEDAFLPREGKPESQRLEDHFLKDDLSPAEGTAETAFLHDAEPDEAWARRWAEGRDVVLPDDRPLNLGDLNERIPKDGRELAALARHYEGEDPAFARQTQSLRERLQTARAEGDSAAEQEVMSQMSRNLAGRFGEDLARDALGPYFYNVKTQVAAEGGGTVIDVVGEGARRPIAISGGGFVPEGGSLALEIKTGSPDYLRGELRSGHLIDQVEGHRQADASLVITTGDVKDMLRELPQSSRDAIRQQLKDVGSQLFCSLPHKEAIDSVLRNLIESG